MKSHFVPLIVFNIAGNGWTTFFNVGAPFNAVCTLSDVKEQLSSRFCFDSHFSYFEALETSPSFRKKVPDFSTVSINVGMHVCKTTSSNRVEKKHEANDLITNNFPFRAAWLHPLSHSRNNGFVATKEP